MTERKRKMPNIAKAQTLWSKWSAVIEQNSFSRSLARLNSLVCSMRGPIGWRRVVGRRVSKVHPRSHRHQTRVLRTCIFFSPIMEGQLRLIKLRRMRTWRREMRSSLLSSWTSHKALVWMNGFVLFIARCPKQSQISMLQAEAGEVPRQTLRKNWTDDPQECADCLLNGSLSQFLPGLNGLSGRSLIQCTLFLHTFDHANTSYPASENG